MAHLRRRETTIKGGWKEFLLLVILLVLVLSRLGERREPNALERIREAGEVTFVTRNNAHCYFIYRDVPMGFEYDLAKAFSHYLGVELKVFTPHWERLMDALCSGEGDFVAASLTITPSREELVDFSDEYLEIQQKVVLHKSNDEIEGLEDLRGKTVHVRRGTSYEERLDELKRAGFDITIQLHDDTPTEELIEMVAKQEIEVTISDSHIALLNRRYYPDIKIAFPLETPQSLGWAVKKGETALLNEINKFFKKIREDGTFEEIYNRYYGNLEDFDYVDLKRYKRRLRTRLPRYKETIQKAAKRHGFDWRLIAAMIYQESHFNPKARSYTGVRGIMQLTRPTAKEMGVRDRRDPMQSIVGGVKYLRKLYERYEEAGDPDRLLIALASYNVGHGHITDAQIIAKERDLDPHNWSTLEEILPLLRHPKYYKKSKYGYCRGTEPVQYVNRILTYYEILKRETFL